ncbi:MAG: hypothetical protein IPK24_00110 [Kineosporiaceae bacterium]|nr:hypothetical protein [Kineosporiaceae bacterium]MBK8073977.1 hypothetical protein [Kineosporiaceae bacterium]
MLTHETVHAPAPYRRHDDAEGRYPTRLERRLAEEWVRLNRDPASVLVVQRWARRCPVLGEPVRPADLVDAIDAGTPPVKDELLGALVGLFLDGQSLAGRVVLQAMLPKLASFAFRDVACSGAPLEERFQVALAEFWQAASEYPLARRGSRIAANLAMETLHRLLATRPPADVPVDPLTILDGRRALLEGGAMPPEAAVVVADLDPDCSLAELLRWAVERRVISPDDAGLLLEVYAPPTRRSGGHRTYRDVARTYRELAECTGTSVAALRQRVHRARARLGVAARLAVIG